MDSRWFREDREDGSDGLDLRIEESKKALKNSTFLSRRLKAILEEEVAKTYLREEDYDVTNWERRVLASASRRKTLREIINLLP